jgi:NADH-quinone oxidoreductase subunit N
MPINSWTINDLVLISPELVLGGLGLMIVILDLTMSRKSQLRLFAIMSLIIPMFLVGLLSFRLWESSLDREFAFFGTFLIDAHSLFFKSLILGSLWLLLLTSHNYIERFGAHQAEFIGLTFFSSSGLMLLVSAVDLITVFISLELASLPLIAITAFLREDNRSAEAAIKFFILSSLSSAILLYGFAFLYGATGTVRIVSIHPDIPSMASMLATASGSSLVSNGALLIGMGLTVVGLGFKLSIVPFQMWAPDVYEGAPIPVAAYLAVLSKAAILALLIRIFLMGFSSTHTEWTTLFAFLSAGTMIVGNLAAIAQANFKRLLAYSAIAHSGYMLIGLASVTSISQAQGFSPAGPVSLVFYIGAYTVTVLTAFLSLIIILPRINSDRIDSVSGLSSRSPWIAAALALALISLTGLPITAGFMGKLFLFTAAINSGLVWLAILGVVNSVVSAYYYLRIIRIMYVGNPPSNDPINIPLPAAIGVFITSAAILFWGILPNTLMDIANWVVNSLHL